MTSQDTPCYMDSESSRSPTYGRGESPALMEAAVLLLIPAVLTWFGLIKILMKLWLLLGG